MKIVMLIVEDDPGLRTSLVRSFTRKGHTVLSASNISEANDIFRKRKIDLALLDNRLPDGSGLDLLMEIRDLDKEIRVILMTAFPEVRTAVRALKEGARDFIIKPFELEEMHLTVQRAIENQELNRKVRHFERERRRTNNIEEIIGESPAIEKVRKHINQVAQSNAPVLVVGKTGTGKELVADAVHRLSKRSNGPLVKVNCSAFSEQLLESELFGHEKGAFTSAVDARAGLFEMAANGTLFLDEISEMRPDLQAKLLRVVEGQSFRRVGGRREIQTDVRIIAATNRDIPALIRSNSFREDLYFRLKVFQIDVPLLHERDEDVLILAKFFLDRTSIQLSKGELTLDPSAEEMLLAYNWPGNVRELRNVMERAVILCDSELIGIEHLPGELQISSFIRQKTMRQKGEFPTLDLMVKEYMQFILDHVDGNISEASRILGIARNTLKAKIKMASDH